MDTTTNNKTVFLNRTAMEWFSSLPVMFLLVLTLVIGTGEMIHGQLLRMGENMFGNPSTGVQYFMMRVDPQTPDCDPNMDIDQAVQAQLANTAASDDPFAALFDEAPDPDAIRSSLESAKSQCIERHDLVVRIKDNMSPQVKAFRAVETSFFGIFKFGTENRPLLLISMLLIAAATTTLTKHHINIRPPRTMTDH
ncbi:MAG: transporter, partial [Acinetobacter sp.]|nr:transporter [Acinetobacter sp.]